MSASIQLPPSYRDFQVYQRVVVEAVSTRQAAREFSLSQTRIRQLVQRVGQWLTDNLPPQDDATDEAYLHHAQHVAADRLSYFYGEAMDGWRAEHHMKYMNLAIRLALAQSKLPVIPGTLECLAADAIEGPLPDVVLSRGQTCSRSAEPAEQPAAQASPGKGLVPAKESSSESPPPRDCSLDCNSPTPDPRLPTPSAATSPSPTISSADLPPTTAAARRAFLTPAHLAPLSGDLPITELHITPHQLGFSSTPTRSVSEGSPPTRSVSEGSPLPQCASDGSPLLQSVGKRRLSRRERRKLLRAKTKA